MDDGEEGRPLQHQDEENIIGSGENDNIHLDDDVNALLNIERQQNISEEPSSLGFDFPFRTEDTDDVEITVNLEETFGGRLLDDDLLSFIGVHFSDEHNFTDLRPYKALNTKPETNRSGMRIIWFENALTGELVPIAKRMTAMSSSDAKKKNSDPMNDGDADGTDSVLDIDGDNSDGLVGQKFNAADEDDEESSYLLSSFPSPVPLSTTGASSQDNKDNSNRKAEKSGIFSTIGSKGKDKLPYDEAAKITAYNNLVTTQRGFFMFFQGILAGFVFTTIYSLGDSANDVQFLNNYQPSAQEYRRLYYLLTTISLVGSADLTLNILRSRSSSKLNNDIIQSGKKKHSAQHTRALAMMSRNSYDTSSLLSSLLITVLYFIAYLSTVLMSAEDVLIATKNGYSGPDWATSALSESEFRTGLTAWKNLSIARFFCAVTAWVGSCLFAWKDLKQLNKRSEELYRLSETTLAWVERSQLLEGGEGVEALSPAELKRLIALLTVGMDRAKEAYEYSADDVAGSNIGVVAAEE